MLLEAYDKKLKNKKGKEIGTITKEYLQVNGVRQGIIIESTKAENPVLLFLHGGPGFPIYPIHKAYGTQLEQLFNVCYWDQRGAGMSYHRSETKSPLAVEQLIEDTVAVTHYLRKKYAQDKIYLMGHSWGTYLGSLVASRRPESFAAYIGVGQIAFQTASEQETYDFILKTARERQEKRAIKRIEKVTFDHKYYKNPAYGSIRKKFTERYGGGFLRQGYSYRETLKHIFTCPHYTWKERMNILAGNYYSYQSLASDMATNDLTELVPSLNFPVFILQGIHDYQTTYTQAKRFYDNLEAPYKKLITFEHSSHTPFIEEQRRFFQVMEEEVLVGFHPTRK